MATWQPLLALTIYKLSIQQCVGYSYCLRAHFMYAMFSVPKLEESPFQSPLDNLGHAIKLIKHTSLNI